MRQIRARHVGLVLGVAAFLALALLDSPLHHVPGFGARPALAAGAAALMAIWWLTEALPIHWTALVPLALYPALGVFGDGWARNLGITARSYIDPYNFLFLGGMCIAAAMQQWDLHRRIAVTVMKKVGTEPKRILLGVLCATALVSMWISNTATAAMMMPIALALIIQLERQLGGKRLASFGCALMLAVAYGSNVGGVGTKIGTGPNAIFSGFMAKQGTDVSFLAFSLVGVPFVAIFLPIVWAALWRVGRADAPHGRIGREALESEAAALGVMSRGEKVVFATFLATAALWILGKPATDELLPRLQEAFAARGLETKLTTAHYEGTVAMVAAFALMLWPVGRTRALAVPSLRYVPWETLALLGGSFAMAEAIQQSGLSSWLSGELSVARELAPFPRMLLATGATIGLSAVASNTATTVVMLNVLREAVPPAEAASLLFAVTIAASCDFALPAGTPPNAIVFGSGYVTIPQMVRTGAVLDLIAVVVVAALCFTLVPLVL